MHGALLRPAAPDGRTAAASGARPSTSLGSGFVIDKDGYILTNRHVIEGADEITVTFPGGKRYEAKLVGPGRPHRRRASSRSRPTEPLTALPLGDSDKTEVGEWVMAVGNPFGLGAATASPSASCPSRAATCASSGAAARRST